MCETIVFRDALSDVFRNLHSFLRFRVGLCFETLLILLCSLRCCAARIVFHINLLQSSEVAAFLVPFFVH